MVGWFVAGYSSVPRSYLLLVPAVGAILLLLTRVVDSTQSHLLLLWLACGFVARAAFHAAIRLSGAAFQEDVRWRMRRK